MTWRRFTALVTGLSLNSLWSLSRVAQRTANGRAGRVIENPADVGRFLTSLATRRN